MKKIICLLLFSATLFSLYGREQTPVPRRGERDMPQRRPVIKHAQPVYAPKVEEKPAAITPEQRAGFAESRKRRFEIMVLINAYKVMPAEQRQALKDELLKRIEADFNATVKLQKEQIAKAEAELKKLRAELAEKEANSAKLIESELKRLLKMPMPGRRVPRPNKNNPKQPAAK